ncbi:alpha/beta hydrolase [Pseudoalteromonas sp. MER144-MNA-CIBAN-0113]|uniref:lipase family alpha/beta hydrolase n=1 Tax=Pseudoalteromonas sp. MER144-MNA-CIBAN-0113 TaxID=3140429 RepID=UPI00332EAD73
MAVKQVVVLHGLYMSGFVMRPLCSQLEKSGLSILNLSYNTLSPDRAAIFAQIDAFIDGKSTALVCHSMGGLVARAYLAANSEQSQNVTKVITLGTPHKGSHIARRMQQKGFDVFLKNSVEFLLTENGDWPFNAKLYSIAGDLPIGLMPLIVKSSRSDGTVLLDETKLKGMAEHKVFHLSHTSMIYSRQVVNYILERLNEDI